MNDATRRCAARIDLGGCAVTLLRGGALRLDGGAMFGIIPKPLWSRTTPADDQNRIPLACNCLLVDFAGPAGPRVIIETGHGSKYGEKDRRIFAIDPTDWLLPSLQAAGVDPTTISDVIVTHLHFDHAGGLTMPVDDGSLVATFPGARVHVQRREFDDARANFGIMTMTYREENFTPLDAADAWNLLDGETTIVEAPRGGGARIRVLPTPGHTRGHQSVLIEGRDRTAVFAGDVMPTRAHAGAPYNMAYDLFPLENRESKRRLLDAAAARDWLIVIDHEPAAPVVRATVAKNWYELTPVA